MGHKAPVADDIDAGRARGCRRPAAGEVGDRATVAGGGDGGSPIEDPGLH